MGREAGKQTLFVFELAEKSIQDSRLPFLFPVRTFG